MSLSFGSLASSALDTARSTFKGLAVAAAGTEEVPARGPAASVTPGASTAAAAPAPAVAQSTEPPPAKGRRLGTVLDAYA